MAKSEKTALVTGGAGFIGHHLARALLGAGWAVRVIDDLSRGNARRLKEFSGSIEFLQASILDEPQLATAVAGVGVIFHQAAWASVPQSMEQPVQYHEIDATGTLHVLEAARRAGVRRVIYAASSAAYGDQPQLPKHEAQHPDPISPYAAAKYIGEVYCSVYAKAFALETISLRYFNVFGPEQDPKSQYGAAIPAIVTRMIRGERPTIFGDGKQTRDFCYIENVIRANLLAASAPASSARGGVINIACGQQTSINDIVSLTNKILDTQLQAVHAPNRPGDVRDSFADITLAKKLIGYEPTIFFEEGLRKSIEWYRAHMV